MFHALNAVGVVAAVVDDDVFPAATSNSGAVDLGQRIRRDVGRFRLGGFTA